MFQLDILFLFIIIHFLMNHGCAPSSFWIFPLHFSLFTKAHVICNMPITIWFICIGGPNLHWRYNKEVPSSLLFPKYHVECDWSSDNRTSYNHYFLVTVVDNSSKVHNQWRLVARRLTNCRADKHTVHRMALLVVSQKHNFSDFETPRFYYHQRDGEVRAWKFPAKLHTLHFASWMYEEQ